MVYDIEMKITAQELLDARESDLKKIRDRRNQPTQPVVEPTQPVVVRKTYPKIRISKIMHRQLDEIENYSGPDYRKQSLSKQYRELAEDNIFRACDSKVIRWYVRKWRKLCKPRAVKR